MYYLYFIISITSSASSLVHFSLNSSLDRALKQKQHRKVYLRYYTWCRRKLQPCPMHTMIQQAQDLGAQRWSLSPQDSDDKPSAFYSISMSRPSNTHYHQVRVYLLFKSTSLGSSTITLITLLRHGVMESRNSLSSRWAAACPCLHLLALLLGEHDRFYFYPLKGALPLKRL